MNNLFSLEGKNAWVTGGCYGIGFAIAKAFAESEFEKYRVIQDREYRSDFDAAMELFLLEGESGGSEVDGDES